MVQKGHREQVLRKLTSALVVLNRYDPTSIGTNTPLQDIQECQRLMEIRIEGINLLSI